MDRKEGLSLKIHVKLPAGKENGPLGRLKKHLENALGEYGIPPGQPELFLGLALGKDRAGPNLDAVRVYYSREAPLAQNLGELVSDLMGTKRPPEVRFLGNPETFRLVIEHSSPENPRAADWLSRERNLGRRADGEAALLGEYFGWEVHKMRFERVKDLDPLYRPTAEKLLDRSWLLSRGGTGENRVIDLSEDALRVLVVLDRAGLLDL